MTFLTCFKKSVRKRYSTSQKVQRLTNMLKMQNSSFHLTFNHVLLTQVLFYILIFKRYLTSQKTPRQINLLQILGLVIPCNFLPYIRNSNSGKVQRLTNMLKMQNSSFHVTFNHVSLTQLLDIYLFLNPAQKRYLTSQKSHRRKNLLKTLGIVILM